MDAITTSLVLVLLSILIYLTYKARKAHQYWKERGVPSKKPPFFFGSALPILLRKMTPGELQTTVYKQFPNESLTGYYDFLKPLLMVRDPELIERIFIKDFTHFVDHDLPVDEERNPLAINLFAMTGKRWNAVRNRLAPIFTIGKLKLMFESMKDCGDEMIRQLDKGPKEDVEMKEILGCFVMDTIGSCAFGIDARNLSNPDNEFRKMGKQIFHLDTLRFIGIVLLRQFPNLAKYLNITITKPHVIKYFSDIIKDTVKYRRDNGFKRNDFIQLMLQLQDKGYVEMHTKDASDDYLDIDTTKYTTEKFELKDDQIIGHAVFFLTGGFDSTTGGITFTLYELSRNPTIQEKVREEILREVKQAGGSLTYDALTKMHYLEQCVKETLRMYPPTQILGRICTKQYTFPNGLTIEPGQKIAIPTIAIHNDPKYYPEPRVYRPERFDSDHTIPTCAYLPFGNGPRICIGMRFAMLEIKYCIAKLLLNYTISLSPKTKPIQPSTRNLVLMTKDPLYFDIKKL